MLVFIDESGDSGFKLDRGSTPVFGVAMVAFESRDEALRTEGLIRQAMIDLKVKPEFKFSKAHAKVRDGFFEAVAGCDFRVRALIVRKELIHSGRLRSSKEEFYRFFVKSMLKFDNGLLQDAKVIIDGSGERAFRQDLKAHLRKHTAPGAIKDVRLKASHNDPLVQLADMCVGAVARSYREDRTDASRWRKMLKPKLEDVWEFE
jgi:Protein of unknown function (DUF3800)